MGSLGHSVQSLRIWALTSLAVFCVFKTKNNNEPGWHEAPVAALKATLQQDSSVAPCPCKAQEGCPSRPPNCLGAAEEQLLSPRIAVV